MELTTEQVKKIDIHLKKMGIKYWDLRIEMIDHIVSNIEVDNESIDFEKAFKKSLNKLGWLGRLSHLNTEGWQNVNRKYRKEYHQGFVNFFKSFKNAAILLTSFFVFYIISETTSFKTFIRTTNILFILPLILVFIEFGKSLFKKYGRSVNLDYGVMYMIMSFLILNVFPMFFREQTEIVQKVCWFIILPIHYVAFCSGYNLYKRTIIKVEEMKKQLL